MLYLLRVDGKWKVYTDVESSKGVKAEFLLWVEEPIGTDEELSVLACVDLDLLRVGVIEEILNSVIDTQKNLF
jgi:hypothetical protein